MKIIAYDRSTKIHDEPHPPVVLEQQRANRTLNRGKFLTESHAGSYLKQMQTIAKLDDVQSVFEVGPGAHFVARNLRELDYVYHTLDFEDIHSPTIVADFSSFDPASVSEQYDLACAFQVLEHFPFEDFTRLIDKLQALSKKYVFISLPFSCRGMRFRKIVHHGQNNTEIEEEELFEPSRLPNRRYRDEFMREFPWAVHYWEIGRIEFSLEHVIKKLQSSGLQIREQFHGPNPYHYFILCEK